MKLFIFLLVIACFLQGSATPVNLALILLISRSLIIDERSNLYLALFAGIFLGLLLSVNVGFYSLAFVVFVELVHLIRKSPFSANILTIIPLTFILTLILSYLLQLFYNESFSTNLVLVQAVLSLPIFILVRFWEERFVVSPPLKLKV